MSLEEVCDHLRHLANADPAARELATRLADEIDQHLSNEKETPLW